MLSCFDIADYFIAMVDPECGEPMTNLKIQKLVYYAQGFYLALYNKPLFLESIKAWQHGPVVPDLYHQYKNTGSGEIELSGNFEMNKYEPNVKELLDEIHTTYGQYSAWRLRQLTHEEAPWIKNYNKSSDTTISHQDLTDYFKTQINH